MATVGNRQKISSQQRRMALYIICAYKTVLYQVVPALAEIPFADLLAEERARIAERLRFLGGKTMPTWKPAKVGEPSLSGVEDSKLLRRQVIIPDLAWQNRDLANVVPYDISNDRTRLLSRLPVPYEQGTLPGVSPLRCGRRRRRAHVPVPVPVLGNREVELQPGRRQGAIDCGSPQNRMRTEDERSSRRPWH